MARSPVSATILALALGLALAPPSSERSRDDVRATTRLLWRDPGSIPEKDLYWGSGSADRAPKPPFTFVSESTAGTKPKVDVTDAAGVAWRVKLVPANPADNEVHAEIAASRLQWALGFFVDELYFVREGVIEGVKALSRASLSVGPDGAFRIARFERTTDLMSRGVWNIENNPFNGTRELSALKMVTMLIGNWDARPENTAIFRTPLSNGETEDRYVLTDLGTSFGQMHGGLREKHTRWSLEDYRDSRFISGVVMNRLNFGDPLLGNAPLSVPLDHARWFAGLAAQLSPEQIRRAFEAAGASDEETAGFSAEVVRRLEKLQAAVRR